MLRLYGLLLRLYPRAFREEYGTHMEQLFRDRARENRGSLRLLLHIGLDLVTSLRREWAVAMHTPLINCSPHVQRPSRSGRLMHGLLNDVRFAIRTFRKDLGFALVAVLTLGVGIGASTGIFSVVNAVLLRPLEFREPDRLAVIYTDLPKIGLFKLVSSGPEVVDYREQTQLFEHVSYVAGGGGLTMTGQGDAEQVSAIFLSWDVFPMVLTVVGMTIGFVGALMLTRFMRALLFGVAPTDPLTYVGVGALLVSVSALACYVPARRAGQIDPAVVLREGG